MLEIAPEKVAHVIIKAREYESKGPVTMSDDGSGSDGEFSNDLESRGDPTRRELASFINALNEDEQVHLVALAWVGRGTFEVDEFAQAVETARSEHVNSTARYLIGMPLLSNYLEDGLEKLGYTVDDIESDIL